MSKLSVIVPCFNEEEMIEIFYSEAVKEIEKIDNLDYELIFVDDGSTDGTLKKFKNLTKINKKVRFISFSRNFGKEAAMYAGLEKAEGDYIVIMDADMQDPPSLLKEMYETLLTGEYDIIATKRDTRKGEPLIRSFFARMFYKIINKISTVKIENGARDYKMFTKKVKKALIDTSEYNRFSKGLFSFIGFKTKWIAYDNIERKAGKTKWSFWKLFKYSIEGIVSFSTAPLVASALIGIIFFIISILIIIFIIIRTLIYGDPTSGWPSLVCIIFFVSGVQLFSLGIIGQYLSKTYLETKRRPIYIERENSDEDK